MKIIKDDKVIIMKIKNQLKKMETKYNGKLLNNQIQ